MRLTHWRIQLIHEIETKFGQPTEHLPDNAKRFIDAINPALKALVNKGWGDIYWEDVAKYRDKINSIIVNVTNAIFDDRVNLVTQVINQAIAFYNHFLGRQERYRQETPEQREAEKAWIDQQRRELERVQNGIEAILNESAR